MISNEVPLEGHDNNSTSSIKVISANALTLLWTAPR
jgi:hypothetical protein